MMERKSRVVNKGGKESVHCQTMLQLRGRDISFQLENSDTVANVESCCVAGI